MTNVLLLLVSVLLFEIGFTLLVAQCIGRMGE